MTKKIKLSTVVVFGSTAADAYLDKGFDEMRKVVENGDGQLVEHEFNTMDEIRAYFIGIDDMAGWEGYSPLSDDDVMNHPRIIHKLTR